MRAGKKMGRAHTTNIFRGMIGTGKQIPRSEITMKILGRLLGRPMQELHYHITTRSLALTGMLFSKYSILQQEFDQQGMYVYNFPTS